MGEKKRYLVMTFLFSFFFVLFTYIVKKNVPAQFDFNATVKLQNHVPKTLDTFLSIFSIIGSLEVMTVILIIILILLKKLTNWIIFLYYLIPQGIEFVGKVFLYHPGPPIAFFRYNLWVFFPSAYIQTGSSYPSGHSFRTVYLSIIAIYFVNISKRLKKNNRLILTFFILLFDAIMLVSRVSLGEHWTTDVIGGTLLGLSLGFLSLFSITKVSIHSTSS